MTSLDTKASEILQRISIGDGLFTEYEPTENWTIAASLSKAGLIEGKALLTGTARFKITETGKSALTEPAE